MFILDFYIIIYFYIIYFIYKLLVFYFCFLLLYKIIKIIVACHVSVAKYYVEYGVAKWQLAIIIST